MAKALEGDEAIAAVEKFLSTHKGKLFVGIDPGAHGAVAFIRGNGYFVLDMPSVQVQLTTKTPKGNPKNRTKFDYGVITEIFNLISVFSANPIITVEQVGPRPTDTPMTAFTLGVGYGMWALACRVLRFRYEEVRPVVWKKKAGLIGQDKEASRQLAQRRFPEAPLSAKKHHDRAEALLLADWARDKFGVRKAAYDVVD